MEQYIYITSTSYSGSTLLASVLGKHPQIATVSELVEVPKQLNAGKDYYCSCGNQILECSFWKELVKRMQYITEDFPENYQVKYLPYSNSYFHKLQFTKKVGIFAFWRDRLFSLSPKLLAYEKEIANNYIVLANEIAKMNKVDIFLDASKRPINIKFLNKYLKANLKVIHLIKDGRGVLDSTKRYYPKRNDKQIINKWKKVNLMAEKQIAQLPQRNVYKLLYRDFALNPEDELNKIFDFIEVPFTDVLKNKTILHIIGNNKARMRMTNNIYLDEKWEKTLSKSQFDLFEKIAGDLNRNYHNQVLPNTSDS